MKQPLMLKRSLKALLLVGGWRREGSGSASAVHGSRVTTSGLPSPGSGVVSDLQSRGCSGDVLIFRSRHEFSDAFSGPPAPPPPTCADTREFCMSSEEVLHVLLSAPHSQKMHIHVCKIILII